MSNASTSHQNKLTLIFSGCINLEWGIIAEHTFEGTSVHRVELVEKQSWIDFHNLPKKGKKNRNVAPSPPLFTIFEGRQFGRHFII